VEGSSSLVFKTPPPRTHFLVTLEPAADIIHLSNQPIYVAHSVVTPVGFLPPPRYPFSPLHCCFPSSRFPHFTDSSFLHISPIVYLLEHRPVLPFLFTLVISIRFVGRTALQSNFKDPTFLLSSVRQEPLWVVGTGTQASPRFPYTPSSRGPCSVRRLTLPSSLEILLPEDSTNTGVGVVGGPGLYSKLFGNFSFFTCSLPSVYNIFFLPFLSLPVEELLPSVFRIPPFSFGLTGPLCRIRVPNCA